MPSFSIILPCFNASQTIAQTLSALQAQSWLDWEAICVEDGSWDDTPEIIAEFADQDPRIRLVRNPGKGPSAARNYGALVCARGVFIAFCDADDLWVPNKLGDLEQVLRDPTIDAVFGQIGVFDTDPAQIKAISQTPQGDLTIDDLLGENPVCTMSNITLRAWAFHRSQGFAMDMVHNEDLEWLVRLVGQGARVVGITALHTLYRTSNQGLSADLVAMAESRKRVVQTAAEFGGQPSPRSEAIYRRYLARRALRLGQSRFAPLVHALAGLRHSPVGFLSPPKRGLLTLAAALSAIVLPPTLSRKFFS